MYFRLAQIEFCKYILYSGSREHGAVQQPACPKVKRPKQMYEQSRCHFVHCHSDAIMLLDHDISVI